MGTKSTTVETWDDGRVVDTRTVTWTTTAAQDNDETIRQQAVDALTANRAFVATAKPSTAAAQASAAYDQTKALTRQVNGLIRLVLGRLDGTD